MSEQKKLHPNRKHKPGTSVRDRLKTSRLKLREGLPKEKLGRPTEFTPEIIKGYAEKLREWAYATEKPLLSDFYVEFRIPKFRFDEWVEKNKDFYDAYLEAKEIMISKMHSRAAEGTINQNYFNKVGHFIDDRLRIKNLEHIYDASFKDAKGKADAVGLDNAKDMIFRTNGPKDDPVANK